jgi:hypothetical protein
MLPRRRFEQAIHVDGNGAHGAVQMPHVVVRVVSPAVAPTRTPWSKEDGRRLVAQNARCGRVALVGVVACTDERTST